MSRKQLSEAKARLREAKKRVSDLLAEADQANKVRGSWPAAPRHEREAARKTIYNLEHRQLPAARADVKRAADLVRYFADPKAKEKQRERSRLLMRALRARRKAEAEAAVA